MNWDDNGYLISKNKYNENSIIAEVYTFNHGKWFMVAHQEKSEIIYN